MADYLTTQSWQAPAYEYDWDFNASLSPNAMVDQYNDLLAKAAHFYAGLDTGLERRSSGDSQSSASIRSSPERRTSSTCNIITQVQKSIPDKIERRREQNRSSQRAYRERKDKHQKELEQQIAAWRDKHQRLARSYDQQTVEVQRLQSQIEQLNADIGSLQTSLPMLCGGIDQSPTEFDLVPWFGNAASPMSASPLSS